MKAIFVFEAIVVTGLFVDECWYRFRGYIDKAALLSLCEIQRSD